MPEAHLVIKVEGSADVRRAFGQVLTAQQQVERQMSATAAREAKQRERTLQQETRAAVREATRKQRAVERAEREATRAAAREAKQRERVVDREAVAAVRAAAATTRAVERAEREKTRITERETRERTRLAAREERRAAAATRRNDATWRRNYNTHMEQRGAGIMRAGGLAMQAGQAVIGGLEQMHGARQSARHVAASREHNINAALSQAHIYGPQAAGVQAQIQRFLQSDAGRGINGDELAESLLRAQTTSNVLGRPGGMDDFLRNATLARNTYQSVGEVTNLSGRLAEMGVTGPANTQALMALTGVAQRGNIELSDVSSQALGPIVANINNAVNRAQQANGGRALSDEQRSSVVSSAAARSLAAAEIGGGVGLSARDSLNAMNKFDRGLRDTHTVENLRGALRRTPSDRDFRAVDAEMFESYRDARGATHRRLRNTDTLQTGQRLLQLFGGNSDAMLSAFGAGGPGAPMTFDAQTRRMLGGLSTRGEGGKTGFERAQELAGAAITPQDVAASQSMVLGEQQTQLTQNRENEIAALTRANSSLGKFSDRLEAFMAQSPVAKAAGPTASALYLGARENPRSAAVGAIGGLAASVAGAAGPAGVPIMAAITAIVPVLGRAVRDGAREGTANATIQPAPAQTAVTQAQQRSAAGR